MSTREAIVVNERVAIPPSAIEVRAARSSGPGGQHVQKTSTKVQMRIDLGALSGLEEGEIERLRAILRSRLDAEGRLLVTSQASRDQRRNIEDAVSRAADLIRAALVRPKPRRRTRAPAAKKERRLAEKRRRSRRLLERKVEWGNS